MSLQRRRERYTIIHVWKILHKTAPNDINMTFYSTRRRGKCCRVPPVIINSKQKYQSRYDDSFHVNGARLWNSLPKAVKRKKTFNSFKSALTTLLLQLPDNPPIPGTASENSLLYLLAYRAAERDAPQHGGPEPSDEDSDEPSDEDEHWMAGGR